jgi:TonB family protein
MAVGSTLTFWKQCEGQVVDGHFPLRQYLGGSDHSAVFLTERGKPHPKKAVIKLVSASVAAEDQLARWQAAARFSHPHLLQLFETGRCQFDNESFFYLVMQYAEEDLSQILPSRALTDAEVQDMLPPLLIALRYLHSQGMVHGHIKPANVMAVSDRLKLSSDSISPAGKTEKGASVGVYDAPESKESGKTAASDMWSLGMTLVEVLTQRPAMREGAQGELLLPQTMPMPFREIAAECLRRDPRERWTIDQIEQRLRPDRDRKAAAKPAVIASEPVDSEEAPKRRLRPIIAVVVALVAILVLLKFFRRSSENTPASSAPPASVQETRGSASDTRTVPGHPKPTATTRSSSPPGNIASAAPSGGGGGGNAAILEQAMPDVSRGARNTIEGTIKVNVRVNVDSSGAVSDARFERRGPSDYFARKSMEAARKWKFAPNAGRAWILHFEFRRSGTRVIPAPVGS